MPAAAPAATSDSTPATASTPTANPSPPAAGRILNVRDFGAKGDGSVNDRDAIQHAELAAQPGDTIYFPAGTYVDDDGTAVATSNLTLLGDGPTSIIKHNYRPALRLGTDGQPLTGLVVRRLKFVGLPGLYYRDGNQAEAIVISGPKGTIIDDCDFQGCGYCVYDAGDVGTTYGTKIQNCRVNGWGTVAIFCNGGEQITNCSLIQDDPHLNQDRPYSSHGIYIHSGCTNVLVADTNIENVRFYGAQIWGHDANTAISDITFERVTFRNCLAALTIQQIQPTAARASGIVVKDCSFLATYGGPALGIKQGDGIQVLNNLFDGCAGAGLQLGVWAPYEPNFAITNLQASGNVIRNCDRGIWAQASNGGTFTNVSLTGNTITNCRLLVDLAEAPGVTYSP